MRIPVPTELPARAGGERLRSLSATSLGLLHRCPERWRRQYLARERPPRSGAQHLGAAVDAGATLAWRARMAGEEPSPEEALDAFAERFQSPEGEIDWGGEEPAALRARGAGALACYLAAPAAMVRPVAVQRGFALRLAPELSWALVGRIDLETEDTAIDLKVKARHLGLAEAERSLQASLYLAARRAEGRPAGRFAFHSLRHGTPELRVIETTRDPRRLDGALARVAMAARLVATLAERYGPEGPWPLADPESWACSQRWCPLWAGCPGGAGPA